MTDTKKLKQDLDYICTKASLCEPTNYDDDNLIDDFKIEIEGIVEEKERTENFTKTEIIRPSPETSEELVEKIANIGMLYGIEISSELPSEHTRKVFIKAKAEIRKLLEED